MLGACPSAPTSKRHFHIKSGQTRHTSKITTVNSLLFTEGTSFQVKQFHHIVKRRAGDQPDSGRCQRCRWGGTSRVHFYICCNNCDRNNRNPGPCDGVGVFCLSLYFKAILLLGGGRRGSPTPSRDLGLPLGRRRSSDPCHPYIHEYVLFAPEEDVARVLCACYPSFT